MPADPTVMILLNFSGRNYRSIPSVIGLRQIFPVHPASMQKRSLESFIGSYYYVFFWQPSRMLIDLFSVLFHNIFSKMSIDTALDTNGMAYPSKEFYMENNQDFPEKNDVILELIKQILGMTDGERRNLLAQLAKIPVKELSLGEREDFRRKYDQTITFSTQNRQYRAYCKDISSGGIFIQTSEIFQLGQLVTLEIPFSDGKEAIKVPAEIVRVNTDGIGLKFMKKEARL